MTAVSTRTELPNHFKARIQGKVEHRVGDGMTDIIPEGLDVQVDMALASMVLSWVSEGQPVTVTVARHEFFHYLEIGSIEIVD